VEEKYQVYNEELQVTNRVTTKDIGGIGELGITYVLGKNIFAEVFVGYVYATKTIEEEDGTEVNTEIGGLKIGLGLGFRF
jgi:outer membrane protein W